MKRAVIALALIFVTVTGGVADASDPPPPWMPPPPSPNGTSLRDGGMILSGVGTTVIVAGGIYLVSLWASSLSQALSGGYGGTRCDIAPDWNVVGGLMGAGSGAIAIGVPMIVIGQRRIDRAKRRP